MDERLNKVIAASGVTSRRKADDLITAGKVQVNGTTVTELGVRVTPSDTVTVNGKPLPQPEQVTYALYKPRGVVTSTSHQGKDRIVTELVPTTPPVYPVGRLDKDSEGLLFLTNNGALAEKLTHPKFEHTKVYLVRGTSTGSQPLQQLREQLLKGVKLGDGMARADKVTITEAKDGILEFVITVHEGRHHLIRRMCASIGVTVKQLIRTQVSNFDVGALKPGEYKLLSPAELERLV